MDALAMTWRWMPWPWPDDVIRPRYVCTLCRIVKFVSEQPLNIAKNFYLCAVFSPGKSWIGSNGKNGNAPFGCEFSAFVIIAELRRPEVATPGICLEQLLRSSEKTTPYGKIFRILFQKCTWRHWVTLLCSNVIKVFRRKSVKLCIIYQTKKISAPS